MPRPLIIAPSILSADFARLGEEVQAVAHAGADYIHVDVMDGHFVPNLTIGPPVVAALRQVTNVPLDVHLMIADADRYLDAFIDAGADLISVHAEACTHLHRTVHAIREAGKEASVALNPATPVDVLRHILPDLSMVLIMSVNPGFGGQAFIPAMLDKITALRRMADERGLALDIEVDGGIKAENAAAVIAAGANVLVSGSGVFRSAHGDDYRAAIAGLRAAA